MNPTIDKFINDQLSVWQDAAENYRSLKAARTKKVQVGGLEVIVQHNPCRAVSTEACLDPEHISGRPCFLCPENRPKEQMETPFSGRKGRDYRVTLNPYPIFPTHLVISSVTHTPQSVWHRFQDALDFAKANPGTVCFYNGPRSGASAPDHMHFQACPGGLMPLQVEADRVLDSPSSEAEALAGVKEAELFHLRKYTSGIFLLKAETSKSLTKLFYRLLDCAPVREGESEPRLNFLSWYREGGEYRAAVIFREKHRPHHFDAAGSGHLGLSPGCADMAGVFVVPSAEDFERIDSALLSEVVAEVSMNAGDEALLVNRLTRKQQTLEVGILTSEKIVFEIISDGAGPQTAEYREGKILYCGALYDELKFEARTESTMFSEASFILYGVTIGVGFHWERQFTQKFAGSLKIIVDGKKLTAVNIVGLEDYLLSVISSEMKASASLEFLKAHAVISRSWVLSQIESRRSRRKKACSAPPEPETLPSLVTKLDGLLHKEEQPEQSGSGIEVVKWFDHEDHTLFDVCADDHCQRYQGRTMVSGDKVRKAIDQTWGLVLTFDGKICDARFSKCCGGVSETFGTCWEDVRHPYLQALPDSPGHDPSAAAFCDTKDPEVLSQVLNDYDLETGDFFSWTTEYSEAELSALVAERSGIDFGTIRELLPLQRGASGRISLLKIVGERTSAVVGKELMIRKWLSDSHLKSSAFEVRKSAAGGFILEGRGWGHGVGLCQIGAAVMAHRGYTFSQILEHYYPGSRLSQAEEAASTTETE
ncbi:MAG: DUF4922 domain-containing protein [Candidatus Cryptobacteroides sp.]